MGDWWKPGTRVLRQIAGGVQWGTTVSEVDQELLKVQVQWDGEGEPRTESTADVWTPNDEDVDPARGPLAERAAQQGVELDARVQQYLIDDGNGGLVDPDETRRLDSDEVFALQDEKSNPEQEGGTRGDDLFDWWVKLAAAEVAPMVKKALEYGGEGRAIDLIEIGRAMIQAGVKERLPEHFADRRDAELAELGIYFYLQGKFARWTAAVAEGRPVSDDTLHDIGIYVRMVQRIRAVGGWPV